jgi:hypothetical protein
MSNMERTVRRGLTHVADGSTPPDHIRSDIIFARAAETVPEPPRVRKSCLACGKKKIRVSVGV